MDDRSHVIMADSVTVKAFKIMKKKKKKSNRWYKKNRNQCVEFGMLNESKESRNSQSDLLHSHTDCFFSILCDRFRMSHFDPFHIQNPFDEVIVILRPTVLMC